MTIAATDKEVRNLIEKHHVYGLEVIINSIVRAAKTQQYMTEDVMHALIRSAFEFEKIADENWKEELEEMKGECDI